MNREDETRAARGCRLGGRTPRPPRGGLDAFCIATSVVARHPPATAGSGQPCALRRARRPHPAQRGRGPQADWRTRPQRTAQASARFRPGRRSRRRTPVAARAGPHAPCSFRTSPHVVLRTHHLTHSPPILLHHRSRYSYHLIPHDIGGDISSLMHAVPQRCGLVRSVHPASSHHRQERGRQLTRRAAWMHGLTQPRALDEGIWHGQEC